MTLGVGMNLDLDLTRAAPLLRLLHENAKNDTISTSLGYHNSMIGSIKSWLRHMGLTGKDGRITSLGDQLLYLDPSLSNNVTRCLLYYFLARNPEAEAMYHLINHFLFEAASSGRVFTTFELRDGAAQAGVGAGSSATKQRDREVALMLRTLLRPQAFGPLAIVESSDGQRSFRAQSPILAPAMVAYIVYKDWPVGSAHIAFDHLHLPGRLGRIFFLSRPALVNMLRMAEHRGYIRVEQEAGFDRVCKATSWTCDALLEEVYAQP